MRSSRECPCASGAGYAECCEPVHDGTRAAATAEELMRSRYSAFACGRADHLFRSWHPRTRPAEVSLDADVRWTGLRITGIVGGGPADDRGVVEFTASFDDARGAGELRERSRFERRAGRWCYLDGDVD